MKLGERIARLRRERNWSQPEFARRVGVHEAHISRWETSKNRPTGRTLEKIAEAFGITAEELFTNGSPALDELIPDNHLLQQFQEVQKLEQEEQAAISLVIDAFLTKKRMETVLQPSRPTTSKARR